MNNNFKLQISQATHLLSGRADNSLFTWQLHKKTLAEADGGVGRTL
jgi:hypothetical protein